MTDLQRQVFLDRYAAKAEFAVGRYAYSRKTKRLGTILTIDGIAVTCRWEDGTVETLPTTELFCLAEATLAEMWGRVADAVAAIEEDPEKWKPRYRWLLTDFRDVPGGRILASMGLGARLTAGNCFVLPAPHDSRHGIIRTLDDQIEVMAHGGGVGFDLSSLRPAGAPVRGVNGTSTGPMDWAKLYSEGTGAVEQSGSRRGALMLTLHDWHPDIERFISIKTLEGEKAISHANLSVLVSDEFMAAVAADADWPLVFPDLLDPLYREHWNGDLDAWKAAGGSVVVYRTVKARDLWHQFADYAWRRGEPGLIFMSRVHALSNTVSNYKGTRREVSTNPCGEQPLSEYSVCNLGAINLGHPDLTREGTVDFALLEETTALAVRFQDNVIDVGKYPMEKIGEWARRERRVGLGIMGLADMLIRLGIRYGSPEALSLVDKVFSVIKESAYRTSADLAIEKGPFPDCDPEALAASGTIKTLPADLQQKIAQTGLRNLTLLTVAPTGTTSMLAGVSSGIEPVFAFETLRKDALGDHTIYHPLAEERLQAHPGQPLPDYYVSASELTPEEHVAMQAAAQAHICQSISKTVNAPNNHTVEDVERLFRLAYEQGCKGITYFRDGSVSYVVLSDAKAKTEPEKPERTERPERMSGRAYRVKTHFGTLTLDVHELSPGEPFEVFASVGATGSDLMADAAMAGRLASLTMRMRSDIPARRRVELIIDTTKDIGGNGSAGFGPNQVRSLPAAIARGLQMYLEDLDQTPTTEGPDVKTPVASASTDICPACGNATLIREEGCSKCHACGYSRC